MKLLKRDNSKKIETADGYGWVGASDPVVAIDRSSHAVYLGGLYKSGSKEGQPNLVRGIYTSVQQFGKLDSNGFTAAQTYAVATYSSDQQLEADKPWIAVDNAKGSACQGNVYAAWNHFPVTKSVEGDNEQLPQGVQIAIGPVAKEGDKAPLYIAYDLISPFEPGKFKSGRILLLTSTDCGDSFGDPISVTGADSFSDMYYNHFKDAHYRLGSLPSVAVSQKTGAVGVVWSVCTVKDSADCDAGEGGEGSEILFSILPRGAAAFRTPVIINDNAKGQRMFPALTVDEAGTFHVSCLDSRNPSDAAKQNSGLTLNLMATYSDDGVTFSANQKPQLDYTW
jgi:hypothetical protein